MVELTTRIEHQGRTVPLHFQILLLQIAEEERWAKGERRRMMGAFRSSSFALHSSFIPQRLHPEKRDLRIERLFISQCFDRIRQRGFERLKADRQKRNHERKRTRQ